MALTRAQLLSGNSSQGSVLTGQVQGVSQGTGVTIASNGQISFDSTTATGVVKTNNASAYNAYVWPTTSATAGQQLTSDASGNLSWADADGIAWTAKGQLVVGTGVNAQTILNVGADNTILIADSTQTSGLGYTSNFVATTGSTGAANIPAGAAGARPASPSTGGFRLNTSTGFLEYYDGSGWQTIASSSTGLFVDKTSATGSAVLPSGTTAQRDTSPVAGYFRYNSTTAATEFWNGSAWGTTGTVTAVTGTLPITVATGTSTPVIAINAATQSLTGSVRVATTAEAVAGTDVATALSPGTGVAKDAATMTGSAYIPAGTTAQRPTASTYTGQFRYNTTIPQLEYSDGTTWTAVGGGSGGVTSFSAGTTGLTPSSATTGVVTLAGTLALANGGTGGTTQSTAINNLLPTQTGNSGKVLSTDGSTASWIATGGTGTVTSIDVSGGTTGLTTSGGPVTASGTITLAGTLALANGGTGGTTQSTAINNLLPAQAGLSGYFLTTDATNVSWSNTPIIPAVDGVGVYAFMIRNFVNNPAPPGWLQAGASVAASELTYYTAQPSLTPPSNPTILGTYRQQGGTITVTYSTPSLPTVMVRIA